MKVKSNISKPNKLPLYGLLLILAILFLTGCSGIVNANDAIYPAQDFSIELETHEDKIRANFIVSNSGDSEFPGDREFTGNANLWNESGELEGWGVAEILAAISPGESREVVSLIWDLDPGVYFLTWSEPEYAGALTAFFVADNLSGAPEVISEHTFQAEPADYGSDISNCGMIKSFSIDEDGSMLVSGETPLPDQSCLFPLIYSWKGLVGGYPFGDCVQVTDGHWQLEVPGDPGNEGIQLEKDTSYSVIVFSNDLRIPPSEPFEILISPPVQQ